MSDPVALQGWTAVPRDSKELLSGKPYIHKPTPVLVKDIKFPDNEVVRKVQSYAQSELPEQTFNHSMRVFYYGMAILKQQFPEYALLPETYALTALLHDIGTTSKNLHATRMSFEFYGGMLALKLLTEQHHAETAQAEAVAEAIFRHQDLGEVGKIGFLGQLIQLATIFDNMGGNPDIIHPDTIADVCKVFPRKGWSSCFASTIREENSLKPWSHTTALGEDAFPEGVLNNKLMEKYD